MEGRDPILPTIDVLPPSKSKEQVKKYLPGFGIKKEKALTNIKMQGDFSLRCR